MKLIKHSDHILTVEEFWTSKKCEEFIVNSESIGYEPALVQTEGGKEELKEFETINGYYLLMIN